jgi:hypothetical protein
VAGVLGVLALLVAFEVGLLPRSVLRGEATMGRW